MDLDQLKQILDLVREHDLSEFEIEQGGLRLKIRKDASGTTVATLPIAVSPAATAASPAAAPAASSLSAPAAAPSSPGAAAPAAVDDEDVQLAVVKSPIVGTFYRSAEPNAPSFVEIGSTVKKGDVLCIIEAMKLMNEIDSEFDGEVVNVYIENGQPVQYGERMFAIRTK
jgi:acetyl-CoA carboxylase biotin carboxyl carrier protein